MNLTIICDVLGEENNGTTTAAMNLIRYLKSKGHHVKVICPDQDKKGLEDFIVVDSINFGPFNNYVKKNGVVLAKAIKEDLEKEIKNSDLVHLLLPFSMSRKAVLICKQLNIPTTASFHAQAENLSNHVFLMNSKVVNNAIYKNFYNHFYKYVDSIHYPTKFIKEVFEKAVNKKTNAYVISNGVKDIFMPKIVEKPRSLKNKFCILYTGRFSKEKSHKVLIDAISKSKYNKKIQLIFAGAGPLEAKLKKYSQKKLINQPILKFFSKDELVNTINFCDLYVHPAQIEIEAIACLEAIACGLVPIIANSKRSATKYFALTSKNLFENKNSTDLANKIDYFIENPEDKNKIREEYLGYAKQFQFENCMQKMENMMFETVSRKKNKKTA